MFGDPLTVAFQGAPVILPRLAVDGTTARYGVHGASDGVVYDLNLSHQDTSARRHRSVARLTREALVDNPLITGQSRPESVSATLSVDRADLVSPVLAKDLAVMLLAFVSGGSSTYDNLLRFVTGEV